jgi:hypothetical protein
MVYDFVSIVFDTIAKRYFQFITLGTGLQISFVNTVEVQIKRNYFYRSIYKKNIEIKIHFFNLLKKLSRPFGNRLTNVQPCLVVKLFNNGKVNYSKRMGINCLQ